MLIVVQKAQDVSTSCAKEIAKLLKQLPVEVKAWVVTSSTQSDYEALRGRAPSFGVLPYYFADATLLKAMVRANPGLLLLQSGTVRGKWSKNALPDGEDVRSALR